MTRFGYFLACEEFPPEELLRQARLAEDAGFDALWISDHFHPWTRAQGHSAFVWSVIGALSQVTSLPVGTAVTCPTVRTHPAIIAQAAATAGRMHGGRFRLGVGSGEALNEHVLGDRWPPADERLAMLEEAVEVIRALFTGREVTHRGRHYTVENARLFTLPEHPVEVFVSAFAPNAAALAGRIGDGAITMGPDRGLVERFRAQGGAAFPVHGGLKVCWGPDRDEAVRLAHRTWASEMLPGELNQVLPSPHHFEQAVELVTPEQVAEQVPCGDDPETHIAAVRRFVEAGFDEVYVGQIGPRQQEFFDAWGSTVLPALRRAEQPR